MFSGHDAVACNARDDGMAGIVADRFQNFRKIMAFPLLTSMYSHHFYLLLQEEIILT